MDVANKVSSGFVCDWFYAFFVVNAVVAGLLILMFVYSLAVAGGGLPKALLNFRLFMLVVSAVIAGTNSLFFYIICDRALLGGGKA